MRVVLEIGPKGKKVVAGAVDWPGLDRSGNDEDAALEKLTAYVERYQPVAQRAGLAAEFTRQRALDVIERYPGNTSTDYWGIAHVPSGNEQEALAPDDLEHRLTLLQAAWEHFDEVSARVSADLRKGPRGGGWTRDELVRHVHVNETEQFTRKVGVRTPREVVLTPDGRATHHAATLDAIREANAEGRKVGRSWTLPFLIRRMAHHVMDHAWEMEDRDLS